MKKSYSILTSAIAIAEEAKELYLLQVAQAMKGVEFIDEKAPDPKAEYYLNKDIQKVYGFDLSSTEKVLAEYYVNGTITSGDYNYDEADTQALTKNMRRNDKLQQVVAHFVRINSGGGVATMMIQTAEFMRNQLKKPVIVFVEANCGSAAMCIASGANKIYASFGFDRVGSIGIASTWRDNTGYLESQGIKVHEIVSDLSPHKNEESKAVLAGNYDLYKENYLNPLTQAFHDTIKKMRPATIGHPDIFTGKTYLAQDAVTYGLIDGILTYDEAIQKAFELGAKAAPTVTKNYSSLTPNGEMKIFGLDINFTKKEDGSVTLSSEQYAELKAKAEETAIAEANAAMKAELNESKEKVAAMEAQFAELKALVENKAAATAATPENPAVVANADTELKPWQKLNVDVQKNISEGKTYL
jgi:protease-4